MLKTRHTILIRKDRLKFSSAHMTVFPDGTKENLHGHNYQVSIEIDVPKADLAEMLPFHEVKKTASAICDRWDEKVLLAAKCPFLKGRVDSVEATAFELCGKKYSLPADEVVWLPVDNVTSESLSRLFAEKLAEDLAGALKKTRASRLELRIEEAPGQGASAVLEWENAK